MKRGDPWIEGKGASTNGGVVGARATLSLATVIVKRHGKLGRFLMPPQETALEVV